MPFPDDFEAPFPSEPKPLTVTELQAALALGRLDGALVSGAKEERSGVQSFAVGVPK